MFPIRWTNPPFSAELRLSRFPTEQIVRAEGYDAEGKLVAADEVILNQPRGALAVFIMDPAKMAATLDVIAEGRLVLGLPAADRRVKRAARRAFRNYAKYLVDMMRIGELTEAQAHDLVGPELLDGLICWASTLGLPDASLSLQRLVPSFTRPCGSMSHPVSVVSRPLLRWNRTSALPGHRPAPTTCQMSDQSPSSASSRRRPSGAATTDSSVTRAGPAANRLAQAAAADPPVASMGSSSST